jgi:transmembrane protein EpsG
MLMYLGINITILFLSIIFVYLKQNGRGNNNNLLINFYLVAIGLILLFVAGFRGDFTSDYQGYIDLFKSYNSFSFKELFYNKFGQEMGYVILNWVIGMFTTNSIYIMIITSLLIILLFFKEYKKYSPVLWLSILMFVSIGSFYTSFNTIRQILAAAIIFYGSKYLYKRNLLKYFLIVMLATVFHKTSIIMIVFYFVLNYKFNIKKLLITLFALFVSMTFLESILTIVRKYFYSYYISSVYGMTGVNLKNLVLPLGILVFVLLHLRKLDFTNNKINIWVNATIFYAFFSILGTKVQLIQRISEFFSPYSLLIIPLIITQIKDKKLRAIYFFVMIVILISYNYVTLRGSGYDPYYFIWSVR